MHIYWSLIKKIVKLSFVTINVKLQKNKWIRLIETHYVTPKSVSFEIQQSMKTSYEAMSEHTTTV